MPTNPFTTSSRRQQILVPKELFPRKNNGHDLSISSTSYRRPVKLPLRKHHSFHFQPSQTVAGTLKHEQIQQQQLKHYHQHKQQQQQQQISTKERYKNQGPLVFKPFSEKSAFKPIIPSPKGSNDSEDNGDMNDDNNDIQCNFDTLTMPRICGTSLKRHISNVETFSKLNQWQSDNEESFQNSNNKTNAVGAGASTNLTVNRRKIHYADLAPLPTHNNVNSISHHRNDRNNNNSLNEDRDNVDGTTNRGSSERQMVCNAQNSKEDHKTINNQLTSAASSTTAPTVTQYATLRFDEISI